MASYAAAPKTKRRTCCLLSSVRCYRGVPRARLVNTHPVAVKMGGVPRLDRESYARKKHTFEVLCFLLTHIHGGLYPTHIHTTLGTHFSKKVLPCVSRPMLLHVLWGGGGVFLCVHILSFVLFNILYGINKKKFDYGYHLAAPKKKIAEYIHAVMLSVRGQSHSRNYVARPRWW